MNRLTDNDKNFGPITLAKWSKTFSAYIASGDDEDKETRLLLVAFGWALRIRVFTWLCRPWRARWVECSWDSDTVKRLGRSGYWEIYERRYGFSLSNMGNGYDFFQLFFGPQTRDSSTTKSWCKHLPWKMWNHVRHSLYTPTGEHFYTELRGAGFMEFYVKKEACPKSHFGFEDYDGAMIVATCTIEEREWHRGEGWFRWLRYFYPAKIRRSLDIAFSEEVGSGKGSWKGGTVGHGIDMLNGETTVEAFKRYCDQGHRDRGNSKPTTLRFIGPCAPPDMRHDVAESPENCHTENS